MPKGVEVGAVAANEVDGAWTREVRTEPGKTIVIERKRPRQFGTGREICTEGPEQRIIIIPDDPFTQLEPDTAGEPAIEINESQLGMVL